MRDPHQKSSRQEYGPLKRELHLALEKLAIDFRFFLADIWPILLLSTEQRVKSWANATRKSAKLKLPLQQLQDLAGMRIVVGTREDVETVLTFFRLGPKRNRFETLLDKYISRDDGYRAHHIVLSLPSSYVGTQSSVIVELQVLTALEYAFNKVSRHWVYKRSVVPNKEWRKAFTEASKRLAILDQGFDELQSTLYGTIAVQDDDAQVTPALFTQLVHIIFGETVSLSESIKYTSDYRKKGFVTCGELRRDFERRDVMELFTHVQATPTNETVDEDLKGLRKFEFWFLAGGKNTARFRALLTKSRIEFSKGVCDMCGIEMRTVFADMASNFATKVVNWCETTTYFSESGDANRGGRS